MVDFDFVQRASPAAQARDDLSGNTFWVNDQVYVHAFGAALDPHVADLVTIALSCYAGDRLTRRTRAWSRRLRLRIALAEPERWEAARPALIEYLTELTDDSWDIEFVGGRPGRLSELQATLFPIEPDGAGAVGLFSGGLDSLAGAAHHLATGDGRLMLVGARSSSVIGRDQRHLVGQLRAAFGDRVQDVRIPLQLRHSLSVENTQRTRGFLFLSLATAAAVASKSSRVVVYENGYGAHNPRLGEHQWGAQATKSTHPFVLSLFERFSRTAGLPVAIELPHRFRTKAELLRLMPPAAYGSIKSTASCDGYPLRQKGFSHCGRCGSCVLRQQALATAGLRRFDRTDYQSRPLQESDDVDAITMLMARQARLMGESADLASWQEIGWRWPSLSLGLEESPWHERAGVLHLMATMASEWAALDLPKRLRTFQFESPIAAAV